MTLFDLAPPTRRPTRRTAPVPARPVLPVPPATSRTLDPTERGPWTLRRETHPVELVAVIEVHATPVPKERPRHNTKTGRTYTPKGTRSAEQALAQTFRQAAPRGWNADPVSAFGLALLFAAADYIGRDADNLLKLLLDALNKVAWNDDRQVEEFSTRIERGQVSNRTLALVYRLGRPAALPPSRRPRPGREVPALPGT